jgi:hypothetical protein
LDTPLPPNKLGLPMLDVHPREPSWILFTGGTDCPGCHSEVYLSKDDGVSWKLVDTWAKLCKFGRSARFIEKDPAAIYCISYKRKSGISQDELAGASTNDNPLRLQVTSDGGNSWKRLLYRAQDLYMLKDYMLATSVSKSEEAHWL